MREPALPPLLSGQAAGDGTDPFARACELAASGSDAGLVIHDLCMTGLRAAIIFSPEIRLAEAMVALPACAIGLQNALGALSPPEIAIHLDWDGGIRLNGASCGRLRPAAATADPETVPDWLVVGLTLPLRTEDGEPGLTPDSTTPHEEGCGDIDPVSLLESWTRHTLVWIHRWSDEGAEPLHREWRRLAHGFGGAIETGFGNGILVGIDEHFAMILNEGGKTRLVSLTELLDLR